MQPQTPTPKTFVPLLVLGFLSLCSVGCQGGVEADYHLLGLVEIGGRVTLDGQPLEGAVVKFESDDGTFCYGRTDKDGKYLLKLNSEKTGVIPGDKVVRISTIASTGEEAFSGGDDDPDEKLGKKTELVPECYHRQSKLKTSVSETDLNFNFDLRSDCSVTGRS